jgi:hypothetical protein
VADFLDSFGYNLYATSRNTEDGLSKTRGVDYAPNNSAASILVARPAEAVSAIHSFPKRDTALSPVASARKLSYNNNKTNWR